MTIVYVSQCHGMRVRYKSDAEIDGEIREIVTGRVSNRGWLEENVSSSHGHHLAAWVPLEVLGTLRTTSVREKPHEEQPTWVQTDGGVKIGPGDEWDGRRVAVFILEDKKDE